MANLSFKKEFLDTGIITEAKSWCFGKSPVVSPLQVGFAAGNNKFSMCAGYTFTCPKNKTYPILKVVYCAKLYEERHHKDPSNMDRWYLWQPIGKSGVMVLDSDKCEEQYGFDFYKFFKTDVFKKGQIIFKNTMEKGLSAAEAIRSNVEKENMVEYDGWLKALREAADIVDKVPKLNEKTYKLIDFDKFIKDLHKDGYGEELKTRTAIKKDHEIKVAHSFLDKVRANELTPSEQDNMRKKD